MTNEETIEYLKWIRPKKPWSLDKKNTQIAIDKAIKALEHEPCEDCISRQAAIDEIKKIHPVDTEYDCTLYDKVDIMYVLKELPPVTPQPCDDYIRRQAVLDKAKYWIAIKETETGIIEKRGYYVDVNDVEELPSVTSQPKTGHWIYKLEDWNRWICSECGWSKRTDVHVRLGYNYCPNCGVRMEAENESCN